jgi:predicted outer membrane protein
MKATETDSSKDLKKMSDATIKKLKTVSGKELDRVYIAEQVTMHESLLSQIDSSLIPGAQDQSLKDLLAKIRTSVAAHVEKAKVLQNTIGTAAKSNSRPFPLQKKAAFLGLPFVSFLDLRATYF